MSFTKFEKRHRTVLNLICDTEGGMYNSTSARQKKNGTIGITDMRTGVTYTLHTNGYIRHNDLNGWAPWGLEKRSWQLNRTASAGMSGMRLRIMATADEQIIILLNAIERDRRAATIKLLRKEIIALQKIK
jgi:hypothetical protein